MKIKQIIRLVVTVVMLIALLAIPHIEKVNAAAYNSKAAITFIKSEEDDLAEEVIPGGIIETTSPELSDKNHTNRADAELGSVLPKTATKIYPYLFMGFIVVVIGIGLLMYLKRNEKLNQITK